MGDSQDYENSLLNEAVSTLGSAVSWRQYYLSVLLPKGKETL